MEIFCATGEGRRASGTLNLPRALKLLPTQEALTVINTVVNAARSPFIAQRKARRANGAEPGFLSRRVQKGRFLPFRLA